MPAVVLVPPDQWPDFHDDLSSASLAAAGARSQSYLQAQGDRLFSFGDREIAARLLIETLDELVRIRSEATDDAELAARLKEGFDLYRVGESTAGWAHLSAYYQPTLPASLEPTEEYRYPLFRKPTDMMEVDLGDFNAKWKGETLIGRMDADRLVPYFDRRDIDVRDSLKGRGLELAWLKSQFDRLNLHIQGSGILRLPDGSLRLAKYAATNGQPYKSVGLAVAGSGAMSREELNAATLRKFLEEHPEGESWLVSQNPRYTFFDLAPLPVDEEPFGSLQQPLTAGRSVAADVKHTPLGMVGYLAFPMPQADGEGRLLDKRLTRRFVLAQDTGGAIQGPGRLDLYVGHGTEAETTARKVWEKGTFYVLIKKAPERTR